MSDQTISIFTAQRVRLTAFIAGLLLAIPLCAAKNPALDVLNDAIRFYASFDQGTCADLAQGEAKPLETIGRATGAKGRFGNAIVLGALGAEVRYQLQGNLKLSEPGALSFWVAPQNWIDPASHVNSRPYLILLRIPAIADGKALGGMFLIERMGFSREPVRKDLLVAGFFSIKQIKDTPLYVASTLNWTADQWHLIVLNWDRNGFAVSLDGGPFRRVELARALRGDELPEQAGSYFSIGDAGEESTLLDELTVYRRPLSIEEVRQLMASQP